MLNWGSYPWPHHSQMLWWTSHCLPGLEGLVKERQEMYLQMPLQLTWGFSVCAKGSLLFPRWLLNQQEGPLGG